MRCVSRRCEQTGGAPSPPPPPPPRRAAERSPTRGAPAVPRAAATPSCARQPPPPPWPPLCRRRSRRALRPGVSACGRCGGSPPVNRRREQTSRGRCEQTSLRRCEQSLNSRVGGCFRAFSNASLLSPISGQKVSARSCEGEVRTDGVNREGVNRRCEQRRCEQAVCTGRVGARFEEVARSSVGALERR